MRWAPAMLLSAAALAIAAYLWRHTGAPIPGCDPGSGCDLVLASRWSRWLGVPVSVLAVVLYALVFVLLPVAARQVWAWTPLRIGALMIIGAALWMMAVQAIVLGKFCVYCVTDHVLGLTVATLILTLGPRPWRSGWHKIALLGAAGVMIFMGGNIISPKATAVVERPPVMILNDRAGLDPHQVPVLGSPDARNIGVFLFDYTCPHCRFLHSLLNACLQRYGEDQIAFVMVPVPLEQKCNAAMTYFEPGREGACEYARLMLAVWKVRPGRFAEFDHWLASGERPPSVEDAQRKAEELVEPAELRRVMTTQPGEEFSEVDRMLRHGVMLYDLAGRGALPKLIFNKSMMTGQPADAQELYDVLEQDVGVVKKK